jgi:hypothetical protein
MSFIPVAKPTDPKVLFEEAYELDGPGQGGRLQQTDAFFGEPDRYSQGGLAHVRFKIIVDTLGALSHKNKILQLPSHPICLFSVES